MAITLHIDRNGESGALNVSLMDLNENGAGTGDRLFGPKMCACHRHESLAVFEVTPGVARTLIEYANQVLDTDVVVQRDDLLLVMDEDADPEAGEIARHRIRRALGAI